MGTKSHPKKQEHHTTPVLALNVVIGPMSCTAELPIMAIIPCEAGLVLLQQWIWVYLQNRKQAAKHKLQVPTLF